MNKIEDFLLLKEVCQPSKGGAYLVCVLQTDDSESIHLIPLSNFFREFPVQSRISQFAAEFVASCGSTVDEYEAFLTWFGCFDKKPLVLDHEKSKLTIVYVSAWDDSFINKP